ncbi:hypothetical protein THF1C08_330088 [Vibrio jasicida]|uniref:Uncharacterized protein n=1 Tax=Vibrio jasicida TaxID=766224 RepID=A0AAU9QPQ1_9VIBR|nr:hypothetical protein THF1C08_330088 [Vibrio jasicida]CAH1597845.1 hypothetical protein THF1A12_330090 [Vibrio jasicida]
MTKHAYQLFNPIEQVVRPLPLLNNVTQETTHPMVPAVYIQLQAEALFGVRLGAVRLSSLLAQFYGYRIVGAAEHIERVDVRQAREEAETDEVYHNEALARDGLVSAIRQSIPGDVVTLSERLAEVS